MGTKASAKIKIFVFFAVMFCANIAFAASSMNVTVIEKTKDLTRLTIKVVCTAHTDGTFTDKEITSAEVGFDYWKFGLRLGHAFAVNSATDDHTNAAVVTITDSIGQQIVGATVGDTLTLSQTASATAHLVIDRPSSQRSIIAPITIAIADTGSTATVQTLYLIFIK